MSAERLAVPISSHLFDEVVNKLWDVVIVGAGPAGSIAALHLARNGRQVLLLDKEDFPRDKICGDGLIADSLAALKRADLFDQIQAHGYQTSLGKVYSPSRYSFEVIGQFITLKRFILDELIMRKAVASGARFIKCKVRDIAVLADQSLALAVEGYQTAISAKIVLIATGANVELPAKLGLVRCANPSAVALRSYVRSKFTLDHLVISYDRSIAPGYAWIFPLGNGEFNIGCGITYDQTNGKRPNLRAVFKQFIENFPLAHQIMEQVEAQTPLRGAMLRCGLTGTSAKGKGNILVIGESIGSTFPFTGEGIGKAMETGEIAAQIVNEAFNQSDFAALDKFPARVEQELKPKFFGYQIAQDWFSKPWLNDFVTRRINKSRFLQEGLAGMVNETVDPGKIFSIGGILRSFFG
ncbi:MAG: geranylgeranyl reductase family protein [Acidobacteriota bacterium]